MGSTEGFYMSAGEAKAYAFGGGVTTFKVRGEDTGGHFEITETTLPPQNPGSPPHIHGRVDHAFYVIEGQIELQVGDRVVHALPGAGVFAPSGQAHRFANPNDAPARWLQIDSIGGREEMFKEMAERLPKNSPADPAEMIKILAKYDTRPAGPR